MARSKTSIQTEERRIRKLIRKHRPDVIVVMGSKSDWEKYGMRAVQELFDKKLKVRYLVLVTSAHRTPDRMVFVAKNAERWGIEVIIAGAGGSAHLPGMMASHTLIPVLAVACTSSLPGGTEAAVGSNIFMPPGCPLFFMGVGEPGVLNAGIGAAKIVARKDRNLHARLKRYVSRQAAGVPLQPF